jgi:hypothetical protein
MTKVWFDTEIQSESTRVLPYDIDSVLSLFTTSSLNFELLQTRRSATPTRSDGKNLSITVQIMPLPPQSKAGQDAGSSSTLAVGLCGHNRLGSQLINMGMGLAGLVV